MFHLYLHPRNWITAFLIGFFWLIHMLFPYHFKIRMYKALGRFAHMVSRSRREISNVNLSICYPDMSIADRSNLVLRNFENLFVSILEISMSWWGKTENMLDDVNLIGTEHIDDAIAKGKGVILIGGHFSTIELGAILLRKHLGEKLPLHVVYREQKDALFNACMLRGRKRHIDSCISSKNSRQILKAIRSKQIVWYAPDHDHGIKNAVFAPFFGHPAATLITTSTLAKISGAPVVFMLHYRNSDDSGYSVKFYPQPEAFPSDDDYQDATSINRMIEEAVNVAPDQYMWIHRRFKTQPDLPKSALYSVKYDRRKNAKTKLRNAQS